MALRGTVYSDSPTLILSAAIREVPEADLEMDPQSSAGSFFVSVGVDDPAAFERAMEADPTVTGVELISEFGSRRVYQITFDVPRRTVSEIAADLGINLRSSKSPAGDVGWQFELEFPDREALRRLNDQCREQEISFSLRRLSRASEADAVSFDLSPKQRETLLTAYRNGYFDVPRGISQQELAELTGTSPTAVSQRLRRATEGLIATTISYDESGDGSAADP